MVWSGGFGFFAWALVILDCIFFVDVSVGAWNEYRVAGSIVSHHAFGLNSKLDSILFVLANYAGTSTKQVRAHEHSPSYSEGISGQPKANIGLENQWRFRSWFNFKCIISSIVVVDFCLWYTSHWGSVLSYDYVLKLIVIIMKPFVWLLWWIVTEISSVLDWN